MSRRTGSVPELSPRDRARLGLGAVGPADPIGGVRTARVTALAWGYRHKRSLLVLAPLLLVTAVVRVWGLSHGPALADDEGTYMAQAWAVQHLHTLAPYTYWYDHPPFGWLQLAAWTTVTGPFHHGTLSIVAGRQLMVLYAVVDAGLLFVLARRVGARRGFAAVAVALWALSPVAVGFSRMVYLDNLATPWALAAFVLVAGRRRNLWAYVGAGACFAAALLSKETTALVLPGLLLLLWQRTVRQTRVFCLTGFASGLLLLAAAYPLLALLKGELLPGAGHVSLYDALRFQFVSRPSTGSSLAPGTVSRAVAQGWLSLDAWLPWLGVAAVVPVVLVRRTRAVGIALLGLLVGVVRPGYLPEPLVVLVLPFAALAVGLALDTAWDAAARRGAGTRRVATAALTAAALLAAVLVVPAWWHGDRALAAVDRARPTAQAERWLVHNRLPGRLLVDDTVWPDLVAHGYRHQDVIWLYKLDFVNNLDPSVRRRIHGWQDFGVVVSTPVLREALRTSPGSFAIVRAALAHGRVVARFGSGSTRVDVLAVVRPAPQTSTTPTQGER